MNDPKSWKPGDVLVHRSGSAHVLKTRKEGDDGWWMVDHGGLADSGVASGDWLHLDAGNLRWVFSELSVSR